MLAVLAVLALAAGAYSAVAWDYSSQIVVPDHSAPEYEIEVLEVDPGRVTLEPVGTATRRGVFGLEWPEGSAIVGEVIESNKTGVTRRLGRVRGALRPGDSVHLDFNVFSGDPRSDRGLEFEEVEIPGELGSLPAWQIGSGGRFWAIVIHGINGHKRAGLRIAPALREAGLTSLLISYRNDPGAPPSPDGKHQMGLSEWRDAEAAARYAIGQGARGLVLVGYSMGASIAVQLMAQSALADRVEALILDSPALDWPEIMAFGARRRGLPEVAHLPVKWLVGARVDVDWDQLDALEQSDSLQVPTLIFHGENDGLVPIETSEEFADRLDEYVELVRVPGASHVQIWNHDPPAYERQVREFLTRPR